MASELHTPHPEYRQWLVDIKGRYRQVQLKAAMVVNTAAGLMPPIAKQAASQWTALGSTAWPT